MERLGAATYGDLWADVYDEYHGGRDATDTVSTLADLAGGERVLELGIGTGRIALPLTELGVEVHGLDASQAMVDRLRHKPGGGRIPVTIGDFADVGVEGNYAVIFVAFNTFFALTLQEDQVRCFANVASHLTDGGVFVIEAFVPDMTRYPRGQNTQVSLVETDRIRLDASLLDIVNQRVTSQHAIISEKGVKLLPVAIRYAWPSELDLMARLAGLRLRERWSDWDRSPFSAGSWKHVSVYASQ